VETAWQKEVLFVDKKMQKAKLFHDYRCTRKKTTAAALDFTNNSAHANFDATAAVSNLIRSSKGKLWKWKSKQASRKW
jgi:hypothetical protein